MTYEDHIDDRDLLELIQHIDAWDIPEENFDQVVNDQLRLMAGLAVERVPGGGYTSPYLPLRF
jgi:hypothetical protein